MARNSALRLFHFLSLCLSTAVLAQIQVAPPATPPSDTVPVVQSNFYGVSLELSFINYYLGNDSSTMPQPVLNYISALRARTGGNPVRLRLGGNSMDSSTYVPDQQQLIQFTNPNANVNDQPVTYGKVLFNLMKSASDKVGGAQWLIGLGLRDPSSPNTPLVASDASTILGDTLDAYLLGNEPDLYSAHGQRPNMKNYTTNDYIGDYWVTYENLEKSATGDIVAMDKMAGPTICCFWDLLPTLQSGWFQAFNESLKYITVQHYPQNNCQGKYPYHLDYYMSHYNTVNLGWWQNDALQWVNSLPAGQRKPILMDEFNSASCGGVPESNLFGVGLWSADYALRMASVGYSGAYLHTREHGVSYNVWDPPADPAGAPNTWTTNTNFYAMLAVTEALQSKDGARVVDLNIQNSATDAAATVAGYAVYDGTAPTVTSLVLFNYANSTTPASFALPASFFSSGAGSVLVRYMYAPSATETTNVNWGTLTWAGVGDGTPVTAQTQWGEKTVSCTGGCTVDVPGPAMAVVFATGAPSTTPATTTSSPSSGQSGTPSASGSGSGSPTKAGSGSGSSDSAPTNTGKQDTKDNAAALGVSIHPVAALSLVGLFSALFL